MRLPSFFTLGIAGLAFVPCIACGGAPPGAYMNASVDGSGSVDGTTAPGAMRLHPDVCNGMKELRPEYRTLTEADLVAFLNAQGMQTTMTRARSDLVYVDILNPPGGDGKTSLRLRVAVLPTPYDAGQDLHTGILQHGPGSWGVHRSNLAVLAPIGGTNDIVGFAVKTKLACWGVLTLAGRDDDFVVPGGYIEL